MGSAEDYYKLMEDGRRGTSARFPMLPPELQPSGDDPLEGAGFGELTAEQEQRLTEEAALAERMKDRGRLERLQEEGEMLGYSPEPFTQTLGNLMYTGAAGGRYMMGEEGAGTDLAIGGTMVAAPVVLSPLMLRSMGKGLQKAAKSVKGQSAETLRKNLGIIDGKAADRLKTIDFDLSAGKITKAEAHIRRGQVEGRVKEAVDKADLLYQEGRLGVKSGATRRAEHETMNAARVAEGKAPIPYKPAQAYGLGARMEDPITQPFMGGGLRAGAGRSGARIESAEDALRAKTLMDVKTQNVRRPTKAELAQIEEFGQIHTPDPTAKPITIVDESGKVLSGRRAYKQKLPDVGEPYAEETAEIISRMPLTSQATKGLGKGSVGMSDSLVSSLSAIAKKEFPDHFEEVRHVVPESRYFDALTPAQQKQALSKAKVQPGLSRDIARWESVKAVDVTPSLPVGSAKSQRVSSRLSEQRKQRLAKESPGTSAKKTGPSQFNDDELAFLSSIGDVAERDKARKMLVEARKKGTTVTRNEKGEFIFKSEPKAPKKAKPAEKSKSNVQTYEDWKAQKKSKPAEKPKDLPRAPKKSTTKADDQSRKRGLAKKKAKSAKE
tara:strand:- start:5862 stop:7685 length:1824 start_codon:yes stop_codon:yes gene_type:complete